MLVKGATGEEDPSHITCPLCVEYGPASVTPEMLNKHLDVDMFHKCPYYVITYPRHRPITGE